MDEQAVERAYHAINLIVKHLHDDLTEKDRKQLHTWINENEENYSSFEDLADQGTLIKDLTGFYQYSSHDAYLRFSQQL